MVQLPSNSLGVCSIALIRLDKYMNARGKLLEPQTKTPLLQNAHGTVHVALALGQRQIDAGGMIHEAAAKHLQGGKCRGHLMGAGGGMQRGTGAKYIAVV